MDILFWQKCWEDNKIGFHNLQTNQDLIHFYPYLELSSHSKIFVPMCGKSLDLIYLETKGLNILANELSEKAILCFMNENERTYEIKKQDGYKIYISEKIKIIQGDFFSIPKNLKEKCEAIYDRAALVALPLEMRKKYQQEKDHYRQNGAKELLVTFEYNQDEVPGPPHSVLESEIKTFYNNYQILKSENLKMKNPRFQKVHSLKKKVYLI